MSEKHNLHQYIVAFIGIAAILVMVIIASPQNSNQDLSGQAIMAERAPFLSCFDNDGGMDYYTKASAQGTLYVNNQFTQVTDSCDPATGKVKEYFCFLHNGRYYLQEVRRTCDCVDGVCAGFQIYEVSCDDNADNDLDGNVDCDDTDCYGHSPSCSLDFEFIDLTIEKLNDNTIKQTIQIRNNGPYAILGDNQLDVIISDTNTGDAVTFSAVNFYAGWTNDYSTIIVYLNEVDVSTLKYEVSIDPNGIYLETDEINNVGYYP